MNANHLKQCTIGLISLKFFKTLDLVRLTTVPLIETLLELVLDILGGFLEKKQKGANLISLTLVEVNVVSGQR